jgi:6-phosphogluconolactonase
VRTIERFADAGTLQHAAAKKIGDLLSEAIARRGKATIALSGGSTPKAVYELLGAEPLRSQVDWSGVHFFWGDERCVPPTHAESNFRMTSESLRAKISIPKTNIHRIETERAPHEAARLYESELRNCFSLKQNEFPRFDVTLDTRRRSFLRRQSWMKQNVLLPKCSFQSSTPIALA